MRVPLHREIANLEVMNGDNYICQGCLFSVFLHRFPYFETKVQNLV